MKRRTVLERTGIGLSAAATVALAGCSGGEEETDEPLPELQLSGQRLESSVDELVITGADADLREGQQHDDVHFAVTATVENIGEQEANLGEYGYELRLLSPEDIDITPGNTWAARPDSVPPGESGTVLLQVSFISAEGVDPEDVDRYEVTLSCGEGASYCS
jgi:hypothetical protein